MASINELRDIVFYVLRKLNNVINTNTPQRRRIDGSEIDRRIQEIERKIYGEPQQTVKEECERIDAGVSELLRRVNGDDNVEPPPPPPPPSPSPQEMIGEFKKQDEERIIDLQKQAHEKRIILNYLLDELIQRRERKEDAIVIKLLEEEFERLRLERERLEKRIIELKEHIRFMQN